MGQIIKNPLPIENNHLYSVWFVHNKMWCLVIPPPISYLLPPFSPSVLPIAHSPPLHLNTSICTCNIVWLQHTSVVALPIHKVLDQLRPGFLQHFLSGKGTFH